MALLLSVTLHEYYEGEYNMNISVVVAAYNESKNIQATVKEALLVLNKISGIDKIEVIVVDDHSCDSTFESVEALNESRVKCIRLSRRSGSHIALRAGIKESSGDVVLCISADGQDDPGCVGDMLLKIKDGANIVWALRRNRDNEPWHIKKPAQLFYKILTWFGGIEKNSVDISRANFFLLDRIVVNAINECPERNTSLFGLIVWLGFKQDWVEYQRRIRRFGRSKWNLTSQLRLAKNWIIGFSSIPLTLIFAIGVFVIILGFLYSIFMIINDTIFKTVRQEYSMVILVVLFISGIQMIMLGVVGQYIWNNSEDARRRPLFFIEKRSNKAK